MNWDEIQGNWKQLQGKFKEKWGRLTEDDLTATAGERERIVGRIQELYGTARDKVQEQVDEFVAGMREGAREAREDR